MTDKPRVGFIGVGYMGHGMAKNIVEKGYDLTIMGHRNKAPVRDLVKRGAKEVRSPATMAKTADVIFLCVSSSVQVEDLVRRKDGLLAGGHKGLVIVDCSTSDPSSTLTLAAELKKKGVKLIDAPLARTPKEAEEGRLTTMVGSNKATLKRLRPLFETWAEVIIHVGPVGTGHKIKLINNFVAMSYGAIYAEAYTACQKTGVAPEIFYELLSSGGLNSGFFQNTSKWVIGRDPKAHLFTLRNAFKDIRYYTQLADAAGMSAAMGNAAKQSYALALAQGAGERHIPMLSDVIGAVNGVSFE